MPSYLLSRYHQVPSSFPSVPVTLPLRFVLFNAFCFVAFEWGVQQDKTAGRIRLNILWGLEHRCYRSHLKKEARWSWRRQPLCSLHEKALLGSNARCTDGPNGFCRSQKSPPFQKNTLQKQNLLTEQWLQNQNQCLQVGAGLDYLKLPRQLACLSM